MNALIVGGANGIGLSVASVLAQRADIERIDIIDKAPLKPEFVKPKIHGAVFDLTNEDYSIFDLYDDVNLLFITAGFGKLALFKDIEEGEIIRYFNVNTIPVLRIIKHYYDKLLGDEEFYCGVMVSIAGFMSSPFFSVYGSTKAALKIFIESINVELEKAGSSNRILNVSPGAIKGTSFYNEKTDLSITESLSNEIIDHLLSKDDLFIPRYDEIYKGVLDRYHDDFRKEGLHSYDYKLESRGMHIKGKL